MSNYTQYRDSLQIQHDILNIKLQLYDKKYTRILDANSSRPSGSARMTRYGAVAERDRYGFSLNFAEGPITVNGEPTVGSTLSGRISHDIAQKTVDFIKVETDGPDDVLTHLQGYIEGLRAYKQYYVDRQDQKMADLYDAISDNLSEDATTIADSADKTLEPRTNVLSISSVPNVTEYVESSSTTDTDHYQAPTVAGEVVVVVVVSDVVRDVTVAVVFVSVLRSQDVVVLAVLARVAVAAVVAVASASKEATHPTCPLGPCDSRSFLEDEAFSRSSRDLRTLITERRRPPRSPHERRSCEITKGAIRLSTTFERQPVILLPQGASVPYGTAARSSLSSAITQAFSSRRRIQRARFTFTQSRTRRD